MGKSSTELMLDKSKVSVILGILLTAVIGVLAAFGYDVQVIQPREAADVAPLVMERGITGFDDLLVDGVTLGGPLIQATQPLTLTAGQEITPAYSMYLLSSTAAVSLTLAAPAAPGQVLYLYGDDANTITVNDSHIRSTDGNAVTIGQYDIVEFLSTDTEWIHVAKSADS